MILNVQVFNNIHSQYLRTRDKIQQAWYKTVTLVAPDTAAGDMTIPYPSFINIYERNLDTLAGASVPPSTVTTKTWQGGTLDTPLFSSADINRWSTSAELIENQADAVLLNRLHCGTFSSGSPRTLQILGGGK